MVDLSDFVTRSVTAWDVWAASGFGIEAIESRRNSRLHALVAHAREHSRVYRDLYAGLVGTDQPLSHLPQVTKAQLMERFDDWVIDPRITKAAVRGFIQDRSLIGQDFLGSYAVWKSSGTTGDPGIYLHDRDALAVYDSLLVTRGWPRVIAGAVGNFDFLARGGQIACIIATEGHYAGISSLRRLARLYPWLAASMHIFPVTMPLPDLVERLNALPIAQLVAYPSVLALLAHEQSAGNLRISPATIVAGGECLDAGERHLIETAFGCRVHGVYACSEFGYIGFECSHHWIHVNADWAVLEPVDSSHQPAARDAPSHTCLLTNLANRVQPIIRYDLGDSVTARSTPCACGSPFPAIRVEGRRNEILRLESDRGTLMPVSPMAVASLLEEISGMRRFQVIQTDARTLELRFETESVDLRDEVWQAAQAQLGGYLQRQGLRQVRIQRSADPPQPDPLSGKLRQVWVKSVP